MEGSLRRSALVVYGSETGSAQDVAEELARMTERLRFTTHISELNQTPLKSLLHQDVVIFAISTTGQGELPLNAQNFWKALRSARLRSGSLQSLRFTSFGLGDSSYPKFNWAHRKLYNRLVQLGALPVHPRGESDEQHPEGIDGSFLNWSTELRQHLLELFPLPNGITPIPDDVLLEPKWVLDFAPSPIIEQPTNDLPSAHDTSVTASEEEDLNGTNLVPPKGLLPIKGGLTVELFENTRVTPRDHWQDVRHIKLSSKDHLDYGPGDVLSIYPKNFPIDVDQLIHALGWSSVADTPVQFVPTQLVPGHESSYPPHPLFTTTSTQVFTIRTLLTNYYDIMAIPRRSFFSQLAYFTNDEFQKERLLEFTNPEYIDELYDYTTRPRRSILEVLQEFETLKIPWQRLASILPVMRPRQFSIASGGELKSSPQGDTRIELLVAIVKYRTVIKRVRQGVCTRYVESLQPGQSITVTLQKGGLGVSKTEGQRPVVMVGPGTGVAPMRSLIYERRAWSADSDGVSDAEEKSRETDILFYGCRNENADYFFKEEWEKIATDGGLTVHAAFSRDQRQKVYVQDHIRSHPKEVYHALVNRNGLVYICGSSGKMPQAVREALIEVFQGEGALDRDAAEAYLVSMEKAGRYKQETW
ncbi:sulfite reductase flavo protein alpha-component [Aulographum hederae CBS 113979]|uniref:NADPH-dependent diflavin oxidoreductase 1 n=1 Tax=Aulographum hederae CBS 113979 TaxID=1176131 RepID=A0A6G1HD56_9PEZI|nr:sulfite reductase flavo protein alpha-component [Aulographum hederae CBS 113979]